VKTTRRNRKLGLTTEEWDEHRGDGMHDVEFWKLFRERTDPKRYVRELIEHARALAITVLRDAGFPTAFPNAHALDPDGIPPNAELARRILSNAGSGETPNAANSDLFARLFIAGFELASWERQLLANLEYERTVRGREKSLEKFPNRPTVSDEQIRAALKAHKTLKAAAERLGISERQLRERRKRL
jgi:hypothetical protein